MLALIAVANVSWFLWGHGSVGMTPHVPAQNLADAVLQFVMTVAVDARAMPLFAFLFGYGMVQFYRSRLDRGIEPRVVRIMMRRRHWGLILLGLLHAALLFYGDILGAYGLAALLLVWIFFGRRSRTLRIWIIVISAVMAVGSVFSVISALALTFFAPPETITEMEAGMGGFDTGLIRDRGFAQPYLITIPVRVLIWIPLTAQAAFAVIVPLAIMIGWLAARARVLDEPWNHVRLLRRVAIGGIAIGWLGGLPDALMHAGMLPLPEAANWAFTGVTYLTGLACGLGYAAAFGLLALRREGRGHGPVAQAAPASAAAEATAPAERAYGVPATADAPVPTRSPGPVVRALSALGQRSLTFYLFQSVVLAPLFAAWGLGVAQYVSTTGALAIAFGVWVISLPVSLAMDSRGMRGPAEMLLRTMTYGKHDPRPERASFPVG